MSRFWRGYKRVYVSAPGWVQAGMAASVFGAYLVPVVVRETLHGEPLRTWANASERGMHPWHDAVDWAGGYPYEVATPEAVIEFCEARGFTARRVKRVGRGWGNNEFVFRRNSP